MAKANSDNTGTNGALDRFFSVFNPKSGAGTYKNIEILMNDVFCADDRAAGVPWVGIARHGPQFHGAANVKGLFQQLITTFPDIWWAESTTHPEITAVPRLYSNDNYRAPTVGVQTTLWGTHKSPWFQDVRYSLPLSAIKPSNKATEAPSFAVFTFGAKDATRVSQMSFYMDRYSQMRETQAYGDHADFDTDIRRLLKEIHHTVRSQSDFPRLIEALDKKDKKKP
jgi:hypothetical protein